MSGRFIFIGRPPIPCNRTPVTGQENFLFLHTGHSVGFLLFLVLLRLQKEKNAAIMRLFRCNCSVTKPVTRRVTSVHQKGKPSCLASASVISEKSSAPVSGLVTRSQPFWTPYCRLTGVCMRDKLNKVKWRKQLQLKNIGWNSDK